MKFTVKYLPILALLIGVFILNSCGSDDKDGNGWTDLQKTAFVTACKTGDGEIKGTQSQCECSYDKVAEKYTYSDFEKITNEEMVELLVVLAPCSLK